jgi:AP-1 complex subunit beta-1
MIWIIGQYAERIENADELLESFFLETFEDETPQVQLQVRCAAVPAPVPCHARGPLAG